MFDFLKRFVSVDVSGAQNSNKKRKQQKNSHFQIFEVVLEVPKLIFVGEWLKLAVKNRFFAIIEQTVSNRGYLTNPHIGTHLLLAKLSLASLFRMSMGMASLFPTFYCWFGFYAKFQEYSAPQLVFVSLLKLAKISQLIHQ